MANKKNNETLTIVKQMVADGQISQEVAEKYFPELAESEDEKVRKWLVEEIYKSVNSSINKGFDIDMAGKALAWLEKKGEQKPVNFTNDYDRGFRDGVSSVKFINSWSEEEKKKLDRIYSILGIAADEHAYSSTCRLIGDKEAVELQDFLRSIAKPQPKQEWSEDDERLLDNCISLIEDIDCTKEEQNWLKSLKNRVLESLYNDLQKLNSN